MATNQEMIECFEEIRPYLYKRFVMLLNDENVVQDAMQTTFLKCWICQDKQNIKNLKSWIFRIGYNCIKDIVKSAWSRRVISFSDFRQQTNLSKTATIDFVAPEKLPISKILEDEEHKELIKQFIDKLTEKQRKYFLLKEKMTSKQISEKYNVPIGTIKTLVRRAKINLRKIIHERSILQQNHN